MAAPLRASRHGSLNPEQLARSWRTFLPHSKAACTKSLSADSQETLVRETASYCAENRLGAVPDRFQRYRHSGAEFDSWRFGIGLVGASLAALWGGSNAAAEGNGTCGHSDCCFRENSSAHWIKSTGESRVPNAEVWQERLRRSLLACHKEGEVCGSVKGPSSTGGSVCDQLSCEGNLRSLQAHILHRHLLENPASCKVTPSPTLPATSLVQNFQHSPPAVTLTVVNTSSQISPANPTRPDITKEPNAHQAPQPSSSNPPPLGDEVAHARQGLAKRLTNLDSVDTKAIPWPIIAKKGQQVSVRFKLAPSADFSHFVVDAIARLGTDPHEGSPSSGPLVRVQAYDSLVARHIVISPSLQPATAPESEAPSTHPQAESHTPSVSNLPETTPPKSSNPPSSTTQYDTTPSGAATQAPAPSSSVSVVVFQSLVGERTTEVEYIRRGRFTEPELDAIASGIKIGIGRPETKGLGVSVESRGSARSEARPDFLGNKHHLHPPSGGDPDSRNRRSDGLSDGLRASETDVRERRKSRGRIAAALSKLESMGVIVYGAEKLKEDGPEDELVDHVEGATWGHLAGYEEQKREIEDTILLALQRPEVYDRIARGARREYESNRPRAILFDGPPGTGKTSCARVIAGRAGVPLLYVPLEAVASKYYGESERLLAAVFNAGKDFPHGCLVFLDEIDALATERDASTHEATRRVLSVLLRQLDGFEPDRRTIVIAATNRKEDLDAALLSRFDTALTFGLPDARTRGEIFAQYARHLSAHERDAVAAATDGMSGRDIRDICEQAERHWASKVIRSQVPQDLPTVDEYFRCCKARRQGLAKSGQSQRTGSPQNGPRDREVFV